MNPYQVEFRYYKSSDTPAYKSFESIEELNQFLLFMPIELRADAEVFVHVQDTSELMEDYLYRLLK
jgi:hypothetical protein